MTNVAEPRLLDTDFLKTIPELVDNLQHGVRNIPNFLSMITIDLLSKQTVAVVL